MPRLTIKMKLHDGVPQQLHGKPIGTYQFFRRTDGTRVLCAVMPDPADFRRGIVTRFPVYTDPANPLAGAPAWLWNGDERHPTLEPSLTCEGQPGWHGWLRAGRLEID